MYDASTGLQRKDWVAKGTASMYDAGTGLQRIDLVAEITVGVVVRMIDTEVIVGGFCAGDVEVGDM
eukprot:5232013-Ditylum_brightwellii.AAC.1